MQRADFDLISLPPCLPLSLSLSLSLCVCVCVCVCVARARATALAGDGTGFLMTGSADKTLKVWDIPTSKGPKKKRAQQVLSSEGLTRAVSRYTAVAHEKDINAVAVAPNSRVIATGMFVCESGWVSVPVCLRVCVSVCRCVCVSVCLCVCVCVSRAPFPLPVISHTKLSSPCRAGSQDRTLKIWSVADGSLQGTFSAQYTYILYILSVRQHHLHKLNGTGICRGHKRGIWSIAFSPVDKAVATASGDAAVKIWSVADCK